MTILLNLRGYTGVQKQYYKISETLGTMTILLNLRITMTILLNSETLGTMTILLNLPDNVVQ